MKCFYHPQVDAVAICKNCNRGLCMECAVDIGNGLACKDRCEERAKAVDSMVSRNLFVFQRTRTNYSLGTIFWFVMGGLFITLGINMGPSPMQVIGIAGGSFFIAVGIWVFVVRAKMPPR